MENLTVERHSETLLSQEIEKFMQANALNMNPHNFVKNFMNVHLILALFVLINFLEHFQSLRHNDILPYAFVFQKCSLRWTYQVWYDMLDSI